MKGVCRDFKIQVWAAFSELPTFRGLSILLFSFLFSFFSAQEESQFPTPADGIITVLGQAQIYSSDQSFNDQISEKKITVNAKVNPYVTGKEKAFLLSSLQKIRRISQEIASRHSSEREKYSREIIAKIEKAARNSTVEQIKFQHDSSREFSYAGNSSKSGFLVPNVQNQQLNPIVYGRGDHFSIFSAYLKPENPEYNSTSKTSYFFSTNSVRPPPVSLLLR